jgi:small subunit ribosomal protein S15Ae
MVRVSVLNDALKSMYNAEKRGKRQVMIKPSSKVIIKFLLVMQKHGWFSLFTFRLKLVGIKERVLNSHES